MQGAAHLADGRRQEASSRAGRPCWWPRLPSLTPGVSGASCGAPRLRAGFATAAGPCRGRGRGRGSCSLASHAAFERSGRCRAGQGPERCPCLTEGGGRGEEGGCGRAGRQCRGTLEGAAGGAQRMSWCPQEARSLRAACLLVHWGTEREDGDPPPPPREPVRLRVAWGGVCVSAAQPPSALHSAALRDQTRSNDCWPDSASKRLWPLVSGPASGGAAGSASRRHGPALTAALPPGRPRGERGRG